MFDNPERQNRRMPAAILAWSRSSLPTLLMAGVFAGLTIAVASYLLRQERRHEAKVDEAAQAITHAADRVGAAAEKVANRLAR